MYRGITLSPVLSKLFEPVLLNLFEAHFTSDELPFGFKKKSSCSHALFAFNESIRYFTNSQTKVYAAFLDASKAFDKVLHNAFFVKLLRRNVRVCVLYYYLSIGTVSCNAALDGKINYVIVYLSCVA